MWITLFLILIIIAVSTGSSILFAKIAQASKGDLVTSYFSVTILIALALVSAIIAYAMFSVSFETGAFYKHNEKLMEAAIRLIGFGVLFSSIAINAIRSSVDIIKIAVKQHAKESKAGVKSSLI